MSPPILILIGAFLVVAIVGGLTGRWLLDAASQMQSTLGHAHGALDELQRSALDEEAGLRGFLITHDRSFLAQQSDPAHSFDALTRELRAALADAHIASAQGGVARFEVFHAQWKAQVAAPLLQDPANPAAATEQQLGKNLVSKMTREFNTLNGQLQADDKRVAEELRWRINAVIGVSLAAITLCAIAALVLGFLRSQALAALLREQSLVAALQQTLRVDGVQLPRTAVGFAYTSATREALVGGDLIDTWLSGSGQGWFLIADASGKGIDAARHSAFVQYALRALSAEYVDPARVLERFNQLFLATFDDPGIFVVLFLGTFDARSGQLRYASAGHAIAFVKRRAEIEQLGPTGPIIGLDATQTYGDRSIELATGDTLVLATDGLTECRDRAGEMLGDDGVIALLRDVDGDPQAICDRLVGEAQRRSEGDVADDLAILVLRILDVAAASVGAPFTTMSS